ncbi:MAG TPA: acyl-CoA transferase [Gammaproteobacteria bacterium]|nr:acyl-CoA transferase [Gammaproteobacteria bacterium]
MAHLPLKNIKVIELANGLAGPGIGTFLSDYGAEVIKIEHPEKGDMLRTYPHMKDGVPLYFKVMARNKKTITLDLHTEESKEILTDLLKDADVLTESFRPGVMERFGLGYEAIKAINPRIVMARLSAYGQTGPYSKKPGFATVADAFSGLAYQQGHPEKQPLLAPYGYSDQVAAIIGAYAVMTALYERDTISQEGQELDLTIYQGPYTFVGPHVTWYDQLHYVTERMGNRVPNAAPRNLYKTKDNKWLVVACSSPSMFERICKSIGREDLLTQNDLQTSEGRVARVDEIDDIMQSWADTKTLQEALEIMEANEVASGPVLSVEDIFSDPHYQARGDIVTVEDDELGPVKMQNVLFGMSRTPGKVRYAGQKMGASNIEIYRDQLGYSEEKIAELKEKGVI